VKLAQVLFSQGFGSRRGCAALIRGGRVAVAGAVCDDADAELDTANLVFTVDGVAWSYRERALLALHKPPGYECSQKPRHHASVYSLLPAPLRQRDVQAIGRLDEDTTGLLLFTDDGQLIHRWTAPKHHLPKVYEVACKHPVDARQVEQLVSGVRLLDDAVDVRAAACAAVGSHGLRLTLTEGRYHQVKRMVAAAGNRVERLHRSRFGAFELPSDLAPGLWRWLDGPEEVEPGRTWA
jgi:16S rRNA pseudouridine516 synthase